MTRLGALPLVLLLASAVGCASSHPAITSSASSQLRPEVAAIRAAAAANDPTGAAAQLARLRLTVATLQRTGQVSAGRAATVLDDATQVEAQLAALPTTTTTTTTTLAPAPPPPHPAPPKGDHHKGGDGG